MQKRTLGFKKATCQFCQFCDKAAMRRGRPFCGSEYRGRNGHCENLNKTEEVKKDV